MSKTANGTNFFYLVDDRNPSGYAQVLEEWSASGGTTNLNRVYNWGLSLVSQQQWSTVYYFIADGHGSTRVLTDVTGAVTNAFAYDAYGMLIASNGPPQTAHLYCSEQFDFDLGLYYSRARYLEVATGRFWTADTEDGDNEDPASLHKYLYCHAEPVNNTDPSGHAELVEQVGVVDIELSLMTSFLRTAAFATAAALTDYYSRNQLFLFHVTDDTIVQMALLYNGGDFRTAGSTRPMFFATTSPHIASLLMYGLGYPALIHTPLFDKKTDAGIRAFAKDLGIPYAALPPLFRKASHKPVVILTSKKGSVTGRIYFNGGINVQGGVYIPLFYSTFNAAPGEMVKPQNYKLIPLP